MTLAASDSTFISPRALSSCVAKPSTLEPNGWSLALRSTHAFRWKTSALPSARRVSLAVSVITALWTCLFRDSVFFVFYFYYFFREEEGGGGRAMRESERAGGGWQVERERERSGERDAVEVLTFCPLAAAVFFFFFPEASGRKIARHFLSPCSLSLPCFAPLVPDAARVLH